MRKSYDNIEYSRFPGHSYLVGYATLSGVWRIYGQSGSWYARATNDRAGALKAFHAATLDEVSRELEVR